MSPADRSPDGFTPAAISDTEYKFICDIVYEHSRIKLGDNKKELVMARLSKRLRKLGLKTYGEYCKWLKTPKGEEELGDLIDAISTNHTFFFREIAHFDFLRDVILPKMAPKDSSKPRFRLWSSACSSGEEPYSIALLLAEYYAGRPAADWKIDCTDISTKILKKAHEGIFSAERVDQVPAPMREKYFQKGYGEWEGQYRVRDEIKRNMTFQRLNLLGARYPFTEPYDVIFCRNVMIYFDRQTQGELVQKFWPLVKPGGYLLIGHAESLSGTNHQFKMVKPAIYQRPA
jgi:chemotaxis protein methyltransferase CheR